MKVSLDTNVLFSALTTRGLCTEILHAATTEHALLVAEVVLQELERTLRKKLRAPESRIQQIIADLRRYPVQPPPTVLPAISVRDPDDLRVLASALEAGADVLVTGDKDLLSIAEQVSDIKIVDPRTFWTMHLDVPGMSG